MNVAIEPASEGSSVLREGMRWPTSQPTRSGTHWLPRRLERVRFAEVRETCLEVLPSMRRPGPPNPIAAMISEDIGPNCRRYRVAKHGEAAGVNS